MELQDAPGFDEENGAGDNAVKLLPRPIDIGGAGENDGELIILEESHQVEIAGGAGRGVRRAGIERGVFGHVAGAASIDLRSGDVDVFLEEFELAEFFVEADVGDDVGGVHWSG